jgi:preprotein translocase subunit SecE
MAVARKTLAAKGPSVFGKLINFFIESWQELKKVSWPSRTEVKNFTLVVIATVLFVGICLYVFDRILTLFTFRLFGG